MQTQIQSVLDAILESEAKGVTFYDELKAYVKKPTKKGMDWWNAFVQNTDIPSGQYGSGYFDAETYIIEIATSNGKYSLDINSLPYVASAKPKNPNYTIRGKSVRAIDLQRQLISFRKVLEIHPNQSLDFLDFFIAMSTTDQSVRYQSVRASKEDMCEGYKYLFAQNWGTFNEVKREAPNKYFDFEQIKKAAKGFYENPNAENWRKLGRSWTAYELARWEKYQKYQTIGYGWKDPQYNYFGHIHFHHLRTALCSLGDFADWFFRPVK